MIEQQTFFKKIKDGVVGNEEYGSVETRIFTVPQDFRYVCFVDSSVDSVTITGSIPGSKIIKSAKEGNSPDDLFLCPTCTESYDLGEIEVDDSGSSYICIEPLDRRIKLRFEGKGVRTKVSDVGFGTP